MDEETNRIKIVDFGISIITEVNELQRRKNLFRTYHYCAPELLKEGEKYNNKIDIYSFGCIIYELFTLREYYQDLKDNEVHEIDPVYDEKWQNLLNLLLDPKPQNRPDIKKVYEILNSK